MKGLARERIHPKASGSIAIQSQRDCDTVTDEEGPLAALSRLPQRQWTIGDVHHHRDASHIGGLASRFARFGRIFLNDAGTVSELYFDREIAIFCDRLGAALRVGVGEM